MGKRRTTRRRVSRKRRVTKKRRTVKRRKARKPVKKIGTRQQVFDGVRTRNKNGRVVSKKMNKSGKKAYKGIQKWTMAVQKARKKLGITGWYSVKKGTPLYKEAKKIYGA